MNWTGAQWFKVLFSNEGKFCICLEIKDSPTNSLDEKRGDTQSKLLEV